VRDHRPAITPMAYFAQSISLFPRRDGNRVGTNEPTAAGVKMGAARPFPFGPEEMREDSAKS